MIRFPGALRELSSLTLRFWVKQRALQSRGLFKKELQSTMCNFCLNCLKQLRKPNSKSTHNRFFCIKLSSFTICIDLPHTRSPSLPIQTHSVNFLTHLTKDRGFNKPHRLDGISVRETVYLEVPHPMRQLQPYPPVIEEQMQRYYQSLSEKDRRRYAGPVRHRRGYPHQCHCGGSIAQKAQISSSASC